MTRDTRPEFSPRCAPSRSVPLAARVGSAPRGRWWRRRRRDSRLLLLRPVDRYQAAKNEEDTEGIEEARDGAEVAAEHGVAADKPDCDDHRAPEDALHERVPGSRSYQCNKLRPMRLIAKLVQTAENLGAWYAQPVWIAIGIIALADRHNKTTVK